MKKLLLIASALLAFSFFGCTPSTNPDTGKSDVVVGDDTTKDDDTTGDEETPTPELKTKIIYEGEGFISYTDNFLASDLQEALEKSTGDATLVISYKLGNYTPKYDYDGVAVFAGWDENWKNSTDDFDFTQLNTNCKKEDFVSGAEKEAVFAVSDLLTKLENTYRFTINIWDDNGGPIKIIITNIKINYTAK